MFKLEKKIRHTIIGVTVGTLLSTSAFSVMANDVDKNSYYLLNSEGRPVQTKLEKTCVTTPNTPNKPTVRFEECGDVDTDKDGVFDIDDECPNNTPEEIAKGVYDKNNPPEKECEKLGCPIDSDSDAVGNYRDQCPGTSQEYVMQSPNCNRHECVDADGCIADNDNDGVIDCRDACLNTPMGVTVASNGCQKEVGVRTLPNSVLFAFDKYYLTARGKIVLDELAARFLANGANLLEKVAVVGHTDSTGTKRYNQRLSEKRANTVANYLIKQGIPRVKITQRGDGELNPVTTNQTRAGRAQNRRVEIEFVLYK